MKSKREELNEEYSAFLVFHDDWDRGAMEVTPYSSIELANAEALRRQEHFDSHGLDGGYWKAYEKLPRVRIYKLMEKRGQRG